MAAGAGLERSSVAAPSNGAAAMPPAGAVPRSTPLAPKIVGQVRELHSRSVSLSREVSGARGRSARRDRREAQQAETDLLRVLGFNSYEDFEAAVSGPPRELSVVKPPPSAAKLDAEQTEAALLRVLQREGQPTPPTRPPKAAARNTTVETTSGADIDELHARISAFEEELSEARFELRRLRDQVRELPRADEAPSGDDLGEALRELRSLMELLREERREIALLTATARAEAEQTREAARSDARRMLEEAAAEARATLDDARTEAVSLTRSAISTVDGLRRLAEDRTPRPSDS